jgi:hypothetical protein
MGSACCPDHFLSCPSPLALSDVHLHCTFVSGPLKGHFIFPPDPVLLCFSASGCPVGPDHLILNSGWPVPPSLVLLPTLYKLPTSQQPQFSPEDGGSILPKRWYLPTSPHGVTTQKTKIDIFTSVRNSNFMVMNVQVL